MIMKSAFEMEELVEYRGNGGRLSLFEIMQGFWENYRISWVLNELLRGERLANQTVLVLHSQGKNPLLVTQTPYKLATKTPSFHSQRLTSNLAKQKPTDRMILKPQSAA